MALTVDYFYEGKRYKVRVPKGSSEAAIEKLVKDDIHRIEYERRTAAHERTKRADLEAGVNHGDHCAECQQRMESAVARERRAADAMRQLATAALISGVVR